MSSHFVKGQDSPLAKRTGLMNLLFFFFGITESCDLFCLTQSESQQMSLKS